MQSPGAWQIRGVNASLLDLHLPEPSLMRGDELSLVFAALASYER
jgi:hypothetical protein